MECRYAGTTLKSIFLDVKRWYVWKLGCKTLICFGNGLFHWILFLYIYCMQYEATALLARELVTCQCKARGCRVRVKTQWVLVHNSLQLRMVPQHTADVAKVTFLGSNLLLFKCFLIRIRVRNFLKFEIPTPVQTPTTIDAYKIQHCLYFKQGLIKTTQTPASAENKMWLRPELRKTQNLAWVDFGNSNAWPDLTHSSSWA